MAPTSLFLPPLLLEELGDAAPVLDVEPALVPVPVGYEPPAGEPGVELGALESRQELSYDPEETVNGALPPVPIPRPSPPTSNKVVPARTSGVQLKPVPVDDVVVGLL